MRFTCVKKRSKTYVAIFPVYKINFSEAARDYPGIYEKETSGREDFEEKYLAMVKEERQIPLFVKTGEGRLEPIPVNFSEGYNPDWKYIVYMGKE